MSPDFIKNIATTSQHRNVSKQSTQYLLSDKHKHLLAYHVYFLYKNIQRFKFSLIRIK